MTARIGGRLRRARARIEQLETENELLHGELESLKNENWRALVQQSQKVAIDPNHPLSAIVAAKRDGREEGIRVGRRAEIERSRQALTNYFRERTRELDDE